MSAGDRSTNACDTSLRFIRGAGTVTGEGEVDRTSIDNVVLSHAHIDHSGYLQEENPAGANRSRWQAAIARDGDVVEL